MNGSPEKDAVVDKELLEAEGTVAHEAIRSHLFYDDKTGLHAFVPPTAANGPFIDQIEEWAGMLNCKDVFEACRGEDGFVDGGQLAAQLAAIFNQIAQYIDTHGETVFPGTLITREIFIGKLQQGLGELAAIFNDKGFDARLYFLSNIRSYSLDSSEAVAAKDYAVPPAGFIDKHKKALSIAPNIAPPGNASLDPIGREKLLELTVIGGHKAALDEFSSDELAVVYNDVVAAFVSKAVLEKCHDEDLKTKIRVVWSDDQRQGFARDLTASLLHEFRKIYEEQLDHPVASCINFFFAPENQQYFRVLEECIYGKVYEHIVKIHGSKKSVLPPFAPDVAGAADVLIPRHLPLGDDLLGAAYQDVSVAVQETNASVAAELVEAEAVIAGSDGGDVQTPAALQEQLVQSGQLPSTAAISAPEQGADQPAIDETLPAEAPTTSNRSRTSRWALGEIFARRRRQAVPMVSEGAAAEEGSKKPAASSRRWGSLGTYLLLASGLLAGYQAFREFSNDAAQNSGDALASMVSSDANDDTTESDASVSPIASYGQLANTDDVSSGADSADPNECVAQDLPYDSVQTTPKIEKHLEFVTFNVGSSTPEKIFMGKAELVHGGADATPFDPAPKINPAEREKQENMLRASQVAAQHLLDIYDNHHERLSKNAANFVFSHEKIIRDIAGFPDLNPTHFRDHVGKNYKASEVYGGDGVLNGLLAFSRAENFVSLPNTAGFLHDSSTVHITLGSSVLNRDERFARVVAVNEVAPVPAASDVRVSPDGEELYTPAENGDSVQDAGKQGMLEISPETPQNVVIPTATAVNNVLATLMAGQDTTDADAVDRGWDFEDTLEAEDTPDITTEEIDVDLSKLDEDWPKITTKEIDSSELAELHDDEPEITVEDVDVDVDEFIEDEQDPKITVGGEVIDVTEFAELIEDEPADESVSAQTV